MAQVNDLSRSLAVFDPISTLVVVVEMSKTSWLVSGVVVRDGDGNMRSGRKNARGAGRTKE